MWLLLLGCCLLLVLFYNTLQDLYEVYYCRLPPGPLTLPIVGGLHRMNVKWPHLSLVELGKQYGKIFSIRMGPAGRAVFLQDMNHINQVFEDPECNNRPEGMPIFDILNNGANGIGSCPYGKTWKDITHIFHRGIAKLSHASLEERANHAFQQFFDRISETMQGKEYIPHEDMFNTCSAIFGSLVYGVQPEMLGSYELESRINDHKLIMRHLHPFHPINLFPALHKLPLRGFQQVKECSKKKDEVMHESYKQHKSEFNGKINDIIDIIVSHQKSSDNYTLQNKILLDDIMISAWSFYLAGCQTVTDMILWSIVYLSVNPDVQEKIQDELELAFPEGDCSTGILTKKASLHYTRATMFELMRVSSPVAMGLPRVSPKDIQIGEFIIPKGTQIMANQWTVHHSEEYWPEPFTFKPERFLDNEGKLFSMHHIIHKMSFIAFSFGKRPCVGKNLALDLFLIFLVGLMKNFKVSHPEGRKPDLIGKIEFNLEPTKNPIIFTKR